MLETAAILGGSALVASVYYYYWGRSTPPPPQTQQYGVPLDIVPKAESGLPIVVDSVMQSLRHDGISELGIFRQSGSRQVVRELKEQFDQGKTVVLDNLEAHTRGDLLKLFLRELPDPVFPNKVFDLCIDVEKQFREDHSLPKWVASTKCIIDELPTPNYILLRELCYFLIEVAQHASVNAMGATNLATCFGPNILSTQDDVSLEELLDLTSLATWFTLKCLENAPSLFEERRRREEAKLRELMLQEEPIVTINTEELAIIMEHGGESK